MYKISYAMPLTQRSFFSDSGVAMLQDALALLCGDGCNQQFVSDLQSFEEKASRDTSERWFGAQRAQLLAALAFEFEDREGGTGEVRCCSGSPLLVRRAL